MRLCEVEVWLMVLLLCIDDPLWWMPPPVTIQVIQAEDGEPIGYYRVRP